MSVLPSCVASDFLYRVVSNREIGTSNCFEMVLQTELAANALSGMQAGQFFELRVSPGIDPLLRRPFSPFEISENTISVLYTVVGKGTRIMAEAQPGQSFDLLGPLGNTFCIDPARSRHVLIAGGIGIAPFMLLVNKLIQQGADPTQITLLYGARNQEALVALNRFQALGIHCESITDDGSSGKAGYVSELLAATLEKSTEDVQGYCCGPTPMFQAVQAVLDVYSEFPCQFALESHMACGIGVCNVCAVGRSDGDGYWKVCKDGPVFDGRSLRF